MQRFVLFQFRNLLLLFLHSFDENRRDAIILDAFDLTVLAAGRPVSIRRLSVLFILMTSGCASVVPRKFVVKIVPLLPLNPQLLSAYEL